MSENKKARVIHVDKLIIHADDVVIVPRRRVYDPWFSPRRAGEIEGVQENEQGGEEERREDDEGRRPFSWI